MRRYQGRLSGDERRHLGAGAARDYAKRGGEDRGGVDTFVRAIETTKKDRSRLNLLQISTAGDYDGDNAEDDPDEGGFEENGDYEQADDCI